MPTRVWLSLTALLYDRTSANCMALAEGLQTVSHDGLTRLLQADGSGHTRLELAWRTLFVDALAQAFPDSLNLLLLNNSGAHTAQPFVIPANVRLVFLPPYWPELNPIARVWRDLKDALAWLHFAHLDGQQDYVANLLRAYESATLQALTGYTYLVEAIMHSVNNEVI